MGTTPRPPRRIVPPSVSVAPSAAPPVDYHPPKYVDPSGTSWTKIVLWGFASFAFVGGALLALKVLTPPQDPKILAAIEERKAELEGAKQERIAETTAAGWVGEIEMPIERAVITISTLPDDGPTVREFNAQLSEPVSLALVEIDNRRGAGQIVIDPTQAQLQMADGSLKAALEPAGVIEKAKAERKQDLRDMLPPFRCSVGQRLKDRYVYLPRGIDPQQLKSIKLLLNNAHAEIGGSFMNSAQKSAAIKNREARSAAGADVGAAPATGGDSGAVK